MEHRRHPVIRVVSSLLVPVLLALALPGAAQAAWSAPLDLSDPGQRAEFPAMRVAQNGDAVFSWARQDGTTGCGGSGCSRLQTRVRSAAGALGAVQTLSPAGTDARNAGFGLDQNGNAVFAWVQSDGSTECDGSATSCYRVKTRARSAAGALSATQTVSGPGRSAHYTEVAVDQSGNAVFVWSRYDGTTDCGDLPTGCLRVVTRARSAAGALSSVQTLSAPGQDAYGPHVAVDQNGNAVFVWARIDGTKRRIQARARSATGTLSATQTLSDSGQNAFSPVVVVDQSGNAIFAWYPRPLGGRRPERRADAHRRGSHRHQAGGGRRSKRQRNLRVDAQGRHDGLRRIRRLPLPGPGASSLGGGLPEHSPDSLRPGRKGALSRRRGRSKRQRGIRVAAKGRDDGLRLRLRTHPGTHPLGGGDARDRPGPLRRGTKCASSARRCESHGERGRSLAALRRSVRSHPGRDRTVAQVLRHA